MKIPAAVLAATLAACFAAAAAPRIAVVRVADIYKQLESTRRHQADLKAKREAILKDRRAVELNKMIADLEAMRQQFAGLDPEGRAKAQRDYAVKQQEAQTLQEDFAAFRAGKNREINAELVAGMKAGLEKILAAARQLGKEEGYDWVLDSSGHTNTGVPFVLYAKNPADLTERVAALLAATEASGPPADDPGEAP